MLCVSISNLFWLPVMGAVSDRVGRRPLLLLFTALMLVSAYPALSWLAAQPSFQRLLGVELWFSFLYSRHRSVCGLASAGCSLAQMMNIYGQFWCGR
jgi:MHS family citrate/tricarballylate:H+ symporter-like MFS transporter